nr:MAG: hypothetical protein [Microvirus sp.]
MRRPKVFGRIFGYVVCVSWFSRRSPRIAWSMWFAGFLWRHLMRRSPVNRRKSARKFNRKASSTKLVNVRPMRGGFRL